MYRKVVVDSQGNAMVDTPANRALQGAEEWTMMSNGEPSLQVPANGDPGYIVSIESLSRFVFVDGASRSSGNNGFTLAELISARLYGATGQKDVPEVGSAWKVSADITLLEGSGAGIRLIAENRTSWEQTEVLPALVLGETVAAETPENTTAATTDGLTMAFAGADLEGDLDGVHVVKVSNLKVHILVDISGEVPEPVYPPISGAVEVTGLEGTWAPDPNDGVIPADLAAMNAGIGGTGIWGADSFMTLADASVCHYNGTLWVVGVGPTP